MNLIEVFEDTRDYSDDMLDSVTTKHTFSEIFKPTEKSESNNIHVINSDSVSALESYIQNGKTCVLNMASFKHPGGGVKNGARAQEECLFRCSNLTHVISEDFYPLKPNECLYTKNAIFFKDANYNYMPEIVCDVVTIAAINLNNYARYDNEVQNDLDYNTITTQKIRLMLSLAIENDVDNIILSAFGCGVFKNDPDSMSKLFYKVLVDEGYSDYFNNVIFSIINDRNSVGNNFDIFKNNLIK